MKCQMRGKNLATTYVKIIVNGELTEYTLCGECAQKAGYGNFLYPFALNFNNPLGSFFGNPVSEMTDTVRCPGCGSSFGEIVQSGKVGRVECYNIFRDRTMSSIQRVHGNTKHSGKCPSNRAPRVRLEAKLSVAPQENTELSRKRKGLCETVESQGFERMVALRGEIKALEGGGKV